MSTSNLLKGTLQTIILKLLSDHSRMYGYELSQKVKSLTDNGIQLTEGALYPALHKMEAEGLITASTEVVDNRARKYYSLSEKGKTDVAHKLEEARLFIKHLNDILKLNIQSA